MLDVSVTFDIPISSEKHEFTMSVITCFFILSGTTHSIYFSLCSKNNLIIKKIYPTPMDKVMIALVGTVKTPGGSRYSLTKTPVDIWTWVWEGNSIIKVLPSHLFLINYWRVRLAPDHPWGPWAHHQPLSHSPSVVHVGNVCAEKYKVIRHALNLQHSKM